MGGFTAVPHHPAEKSLSIDHHLSLKTCTEKWNESLTNFLFLNWKWICFSFVLFLIINIKWIDDRFVTFGFSLLCKYRLWPKLFTGKFIKMILVLKWFVRKHLMICIRQKICMRRTFKQKICLWGKWEVTERVYKILQNSKAHVLSCPPPTHQVSSAPDDPLFPSGCWSSAHVDLLSPASL